ncbi:hypothetical protein H4R19_003255 [Coemansia spiralis]|nr:hypothetical protein H4R19_003255 [Coemansia spiralis]
MAQRERRYNAGNRLATMVAEERAKIASGEAALSDDDDDFARRPGAGGGDDDDDLVESDFEETDSEAERAADEETKGAEAAVERAERRQQRRRKTARKRHVVPHFAGAAPRQPAAAAAAEAPRTHTRKRPVLAVRVSSRTLAVRKAQETEERTQERELKAKRRRRRGGVEADSQPALTQEQLLEEAKATEIENLEKLRDFQAQAAEDKQRLVATRRAPLMRH